MDMYRIKTGEVLKLLLVVALGSVAFGGTVEQRLAQWKSLNDITDEDVANVASWKSRRVAAIMAMLGQECTHESLFPNSGENPYNDTSSASEINADNNKLLRLLDLLQKKEKKRHSLTHTRHILLEMAIAMNEIHKEFKANNEGVKLDTKVSNLKLESNDMERLKAELRAEVRSEQEQMKKEWIRDAKAAFREEFLTEQEELKGIKSKIQELEKQLSLRATRNEIQQVRSDVKQIKSTTLVSSEEMKQLKQKIEKVNGSTGKLERDVLSFQSKIANLEKNKADVALVWQYNQRQTKILEESLSMIAKHHMTTHKAINLMFETLFKESKIRMVKFTMNTSKGGHEMEMLLNDFVQVKTREIASPLPYCAECLSTSNKLLIRQNKTFICESCKKYPPSAPVYIPEGMGPGYSENQFA